MTGLELTGKENLKNIHKSLAAGVGYALIAMLFFGVAFFLVDYVVVLVGGIITILFVRGIGFIYLAAYSPVKKMDYSIPAKSVLLVLVAMGVMDALGYWSYFTGIDGGLVAVVAPMVAFAPATAAILSRIFYKEKLFLNQKIGIAISVIGMVLLSVV